MKEPLFHATDLLAGDAVTDREQYLRLFRGLGVRYRMEASVWYLHSRTAAGSIAAMSPRRQDRDPAPPPRRVDRLSPRSPPVHRS
jgi:hypothetical protein